MLRPVKHVEVTTLAFRSCPQGRGVSKRFSTLAGTPVPSTKRAKRLETLSYMVEYA
jgi:hypothetical protein